MTTFPEAESVKRAWLPRRNIAGCIADTMARPPGLSTRCASTEESGQIAEMFEDQPAHHRIERCVPERQRIVQVVGDEAHIAGRDPRPGLLEHARRKIDRGDAGSRLGEPHGVPAGPATEVQHLPAAHAAERLADARLLEGRQRIDVVVVDLRPPVVAVAHPRERFVGAGHGERIRVRFHPWIISRRLRSSTGNGNPEGPPDPRCSPGRAGC